MEPLSLAALTDFAVNNPIQTGFNVAVGAGLVVKYTARSTHPALKLINRVATFLSSKTGQAVTGRLRARVRARRAARAAR